MLWYTARNVGGRGPIRYEKINFIRICWKSAEIMSGAHCNYFGPTMGGRVGLPAYFRFLKVALTAYTEDIFVHCLIKTGKNVPFYQNTAC